MSAPPLAELVSAATDRRSDCRGLGSAFSACPGLDGPVPAELRYRLVAWPARRFHENGNSWSRPAILPPGACWPFRVGRRRCRAGRRPRRYDFGRAVSFAAGEAG